MAVHVDLLLIVFCSEVVPSVNAVPVLKAYSLMVIVVEAEPSQGSLQFVDEPAPETVIAIIAVSLPSLTVSAVGSKVVVPVDDPAGIVMLAILA